MHLFPLFPSVFRPSPPPPTPNRIGDVEMEDGQRTNHSQCDGGGGVCSEGSQGHEHGGRSNLFAALVGEPALC